MDLISVSHPSIDRDLDFQNESLSLNLLKYTIVVAMPKLTEEGFYMCIEECLKNPGLGVAKNLKKHIQAPRGVSVGLKVRFKPAKEYRHVSKKALPTLAVIRRKVWSLLKSFEKLIIVEKITLVDDDDKPLKKIDYPGDHDNVDEVELVDNDMALSMASISIGFGTKSLLKKWKDSYENDDYDEDPYDDDMYEGQGILDKIQDICNNLDIRVRSRRKK
ncbi:hypothetical protein Tco_1421958 [Tanacetum coccineum]